MGPNVTQQPTRGRSYGGGGYEAAVLFARCMDPDGPLEPVELTARAYRPGQSETSFSAKIHRLGFEGRLTKRRLRRANGRFVAGDID